MKNSQINGPFKNSRSRNNEGPRYYNTQNNKGRKLSVIEKNHSLVQNLKLL